MIKEFISGQDAAEIVFKKDRISNFTFDLADEALNINIQPSLILANGAEKEQATVSHSIVEGESDYAQPVSAEALSAFRALKTSMANQVADFYETYILKIEE